MEHSPPVCTLDSVQAGDLSQIALLFTDPKVRSFLGGPLSTAAAEQRARTLLRSSGQARVWAVRQTTGKQTPLLGVVLLDRHHDPEEFEVSYLLLPEHWGHGYATEAVRQALAHAFSKLGLRRVLAETQSANIASVRLLERLGLRLHRKVYRFGAEQSIYVAEPRYAQPATYPLRQGDVLRQGASRPLPRTLGATNTEAHAP